MSELQSLTALALKGGREGGGFQHINYLMTMNRACPISEGTHYGCIFSV